MNLSENTSRIDLLVNNTFSYPDACSATAKFHKDTQWGDLNIQCAAGSCEIIHESPGTVLRFDNFTVQGAKVDLNILDIAASAVNVTVERGILTFNNAAVKKDSIISTQDGDVIFQSS